MTGISTEAMLETLQQEQPLYTPSEATAIELGSKTLGMIVGPAHSGKSTVITKACRIDPDFEAASALTTRPRRDSDTPGEYTFYPHDQEGIGEIFRLQQRGELVQYVAFRGLGFIYGSVAQDYPGAYNLRPVLADGVPGMLNVPFLRIHTIGIACPPQDWDARDQASIRLRGAKAAAQRPARIREGVASLNKMLSSPDTQWVSNPNSDLLHAACAVIDIVKRDEEAPKENRQVAERLHKHLVQREKEL